MDYDQITRYFNAASDHYELHAKSQNQSAAQLIEFYRQYFAHFPIHSLLDVGTGTGFIPQLLLPHLPDAQYVLNDIAPNMLRFCQSKFKNHSFQYLLGNIDTINIPQVDLITSNFSLQWSDKLIPTIDKLFTHSKILAMTCLLPGTFSEWYKLLGTPNLIPYPDRNDLISYLLKLDPDAKILIKSYPLVFKTPKAFLLYLHHIGGAHSKIKVPLSNLKQILALKSTFTTQYQVLFTVLKRSSCAYL